MDLTIPEATAVIDELAGRIHDLIGTEYRDAALTAADRAEAAADRIGSAEQVQEWVDSVSASADRSTSAADRSTSEADRAASAVAEEIEKLKGTAPEAFDTLGEIAAELARNETERASLANTIGEKARRDDMDTALAGKADVGHRHTTEQVDGLDDALTSASQSAEWSAVGGKPTVFPPSSHKHEDLETAIAGKAEAQHKHVLEDISDMPEISTDIIPETLVQRLADGRIQVSEPQNGSDPATVNYVDGKVNRKANAQHRHQVSQIDGLDALIDQRAGVLVEQAPKTHVWDGVGTWSPPVGTGPNDSVINLDTGEIHSVEAIP